MFNGSFLRVCRILWFVQKIDFAFLSLGAPNHGARVWCLGRVPKHRNYWQELEGLLFSPPWKKIRQKYGTQQEPSLFKRYPFSC